MCERVPFCCYGIYAEKANKDPNTKFDIVKVDSNTIRLKNSANGKYLTRWHSSRPTYIQARKSSPDIHCNFLVYEVDGKLVLKVRFMSYSKCFNCLQISKLASNFECLSAFAILLGFTQAH